MISDKRRREILKELGEDARQFAEGWRLASAYGKAGDTKMRDYFMNSIMQPREPINGHSTETLLPLLIRRNIILYKRFWQNEAKFAHVFNDARMFVGPRSSKRSRSRSFATTLIMLNEFPICRDAAAPTLI